MYADETPDFAVTQSSSNTTRVLQHRPETTKSDLCAKAFEACIKGLAPRLEPARALDENFLRLFRYCHRTWKDGITALQEELIVLSRRWDGLNTPGECPYIPLTGVELEKHRKRNELFTISLKLKKDLIEILDTDSAGQVPNEAFQKTKETEQAVFAQLSQAIAQELDADMTMDDLKQMWPFDLHRAAATHD